MRQAGLQSSVQSCPSTYVILLVGLMLISEAETMSVLTVCTASDAKPVRAQRCMAAWVLTCSCMGDLGVCTGRR